MRVHSILLPIIGIAMIALIFSVSKRPHQPSTTDSAAPEQRRFIQSPALRLLSTLRRLADAVDETTALQRLPHSDTATVSLGDPEQHYTVLKVDATQRILLCVGAAPDNRVMAVAAADFDEWNKKGDTLELRDFSVLDHPGWFFLSMRPTAEFVDSIAKEDVSSPSAPLARLLHILAELAGPIDEKTALQKLPHTEFGTIPLGNSGQHYTVLKNDGSRRVLLDVGGGGDDARVRAIAVADFDEWKKNGDVLELHDAHVFDHPGWVMLSASPAGPTTLPQ